MTFPAPVAEETGKAGDDSLGVVGTETLGAKAADAAVVEADVVESDVEVFVTRGA
jgi:hypothetical protein